MKLLQTQYDADINLLKQEHAVSASKVLYILVVISAESHFYFIWRVDIESQVGPNYWVFEISLNFVLFLK